MTHEDYMDIALAAALEAHDRGDWPVASLIVKDGEIIGRGQNEQITRTDVTWHAETAAIRDAQQNLGTSDLSGCTLYGPMEPCPMCAWAIRIAGIDRLVLALRHATLKRTDMGVYSLESFARMVGWQVEIIQNVREAEYLALRRSWMDAQTKA
jgi:tRNA(adenine34) deaminase